MGKIYLFALFLIVQAIAFQTLHYEQKINKNPEVHTPLDQINNDNPDKKDQENDRLKGDVACIRQFSSDYAYPTLCQSQTPLPIKIYTSFKLKMNANWYADNDFNFYLQDAYQNAHFFDDKACLYSTTPGGNKQSGTSLSIWITCYRTPKQLTYGDHIYIEAFVNKKHTKHWLGYGVPLPGYSTEQFIQSLPKRQRRSNAKKPMKNKQLILDEQPTETEQKEK